MMTPAQHYCVSAGVTSLGAFLLSIWIYLKASNRRLATRFVYYSLVIAIWSLFVFLCTSAKDFRLAYSYAIACNMAALFIPAAFLHFTVELTRNRSAFLSGAIRMGYAASGLIALMTMVNPGLLVRSVSTRMTFSYFPDPGPLFLVWNAIFIQLIFVGFVVLVEEARRERGRKRKALVLFLSANLIGFSGGSACFFAIYDLNWFPFPFGIWGIFLFVVLTAYTVMRYQMIEIHYLIRKTAVYSGMVLFAYLVFAAFTIAGRRFFEDQLGWNAWISAVPMMTILALTLGPIDKMLNKTVDRFLGSSIQYRDLTSRFMNELRSASMDAEQIARSTLYLLTVALEAADSAVLIRNPASRKYEVLAATGPGFGGFRLEYRWRLYDKIGSRGHAVCVAQDRRLVPAEKKILLAKSVAAAAPLQVRNTVLGMLILSKKCGGLNYTGEEAELLTDLSRGLAVALHNAQLFREKADSEKRAIVGTMAAGIRHEIRNPLNIINLKLGSIEAMENSGWYRDYTKEQLMREVISNNRDCLAQVSRINEIAGRISEFAKPAEGAAVRGPADLAQIAESCVGLMRYEKAMEGISVKVENRCADSRVKADAGQMHQVLINLMTNAAHGVKGRQNAAIEIRMEAARTSGEVCLKVLDNGCGVPPEERELIFSPYFTTKRKDGGQGLGLALVRAIVESNGGGINIMNREGGGSVFCVTLKKWLQ